MLRVVLATLDVVSLQTSVLVKIVHFLCLLLSIIALRFNKL